LSGWGYPPKGSPVTVWRVSEREGANGRVAVVLPGGGARGAYEIGALSVLLPRLEAAGERVSIYCGTSVGAVNAAMLASRAHLPAREAIAEIADMWRSMRTNDVLARGAGARAAFNGLRLAAESALGGPARHPGLLDTRPLRRTLERSISFKQLALNVREGHLDAACVLATGLADDLPTAFVACRDPTDLHTASEQIRYVRARFAPEHVLASAAIPLLFAPVQIGAPRAAAGFYIDGATRLNTPLKPALDLGAERLVVIGFEPLAVTRRARARGRSPQLADIAANLLDRLMLDQVTADLHRLAAINLFFTASASGAVDPQHTRAAEAYRQARGRRPYRRIQYAIVAPSSRRTLGLLAERVLAERRNPLRGLTSVDSLLLRRLLGSAGASRGELLSFVLFDERYISALFDAGRRDARRWLKRHPKIWCSDPAHDFGGTLRQPPADHELTSLEEWRRLRGGHG
jgi:NTE family protein